MAVWGGSPKCQCEKRGAPCSPYDDCNEGLWVECGRQL